LIEHEPDSYAAITTLAEVQRDLLNRPDDAIATLQRGLANVAEDDQDELREEIIDTYLEFNRVGDAEKFWHAENDTDEETERDYLGLIRIQLRRKDIPGARASAQNIESEPARNHWLGIVEARAHNFDIARKLWADDLEEPKFDRWSFWFVWVELHLRLREFDQVIEKVDPVKLRAGAPGYFYLAIAHAATGDMGRAADLAREGRAEMKRSSRRIHWASIDRETRELADELELSPAARRPIEI
jgi:hypothetical protein